MSEKRRDKRGRILHNGEIQMPDGRYRYKYTDGFGEVRWIRTIQCPAAKNQKYPCVKRNGR